MRSLVAAFAIRFRRMIASSGERSSMPSRGRNWRIGERMGSVMSCRKTTTGLRGSIPVQERMMRMKMAIERIQERIWMNRTAASIGLSSQPPRFVVGGLYGLDEGEAKAGLLQRSQPLGGRAGGRCDLVAEVGRVLASNLGVLRGAQYRLDHHALGHIAAQADMDGAVDPRPPPQEDAAGAPGADRRGHVHLLLVVDVH